MGSRTAIIDSSLVTVPLTSLRRAAKDRKALIDEANAAIADLAQVEHLPKEQQLAQLDSLVSQLQGLKRKLRDVSKIEHDDSHRCKARLEHLCSMGQSPATGTVAWNQQRLDRILVDHLLRSGFHESAVNLASDAGIADLVDVHIFQGARQVLDALQRHDCSTALAWCEENQARLRKVRSNLEFKLRVQEFVELVRAGRRPHAIQYARAHLAPWAEAYLGDLQQVMAALVFKPDTSCEPYSQLFHASQWDALAQLYLRDLYRLHALPAESLLAVHLRAGLAVLHNPQPADGGRSQEDPLHTPEFQRLAEGLPHAKHTKSKLICYVTGELMSEDNPAMALPNGYVYSARGIAALQARHAGRVVCPKTGDTFAADELRRAYIVS